MDVLGNHRESAGDRTLTPPPYWQQATRPQASEPLRRQGLGHVGDSAVAVLHNRVCSWGLKSEGAAAEAFEPAVDGL